MSQPTDTPLADALEPLVERLEAQLPATRRMMEYERRHGRDRRADNKGGNREM